MAAPSFGGARAKTLDFDIECRPLSWFGGDWVTKEVTAIGARWLDKKKTHVWLLGVDSPEDMLLGFKEMYDEADIVTGHFIRGFDLPVLNAALLDLELPGLGEKFTVDTKLDLVKFSGLSKSQENLGALLGLDSPKVQMNQATWREANRLTPEGIRLVKERVVGDVAQHIEMLAELRRRGLLGPGKVWSPRPGAGARYSP